MLNQLSVFVENKAGRLASVMKILNDNNIDIRAMTIADTTDFGIVRMIIKNYEDALKILKDNDCTVNATKVVAFSVPDQPGGMYSVIDAFESAGINIEYCYSLVTNKEGRASVAVRVDNNDKAVEVLNAKGISLISEDDLGLDVFLKVSMIYALYRAYGAHRHEYRRLYLSVVRGDHTAAGRRLRVIMRLYELHPNSF